MRRVGFTLVEFLVSVVIGAFLVVHPAGVGQENAL